MDITPQHHSLPLELLRLSRPKQWVKNILVLAVPAAGGQLLDLQVLTASLGGLVAFCLASVATYVINDVSDRERDRKHPKKHRRPVAAGTVSVAVASALGVGSTVGSIALGWAISPGLAYVLIGYMALTVCYSRYLKHVAVVELGCVSAGFLLRMLAGAAATGIPASSWFLIVGGAGSFLIVAGKRFGELQTIGSAAGTRSVLAEYTEGFLRVAYGAGLVMAAIAYCLWALDPARAGLWHQLSIAPFALGLLRYVLLVEHAKGSAPEDAVADHVLIICGMAWSACFFLAVYV